MGVPGDAELSPDRCRRRSRCHRTADIGRIAPSAPAATRSGHRSDAAFQPFERHPRNGVGRRRATDGPRHRSLGRMYPAEWSASVETRADIRRCRRPVQALLASVSPGSRRSPRCEDRPSPRDRLLIASQSSAAARPRFAALPATSRCPRLRRALQPAIGSPRAVEPVGPTMCSDARRPRRLELRSPACRENTRGPDGEFRCPSLPVSSCSPASSARASR